MALYSYVRAALLRVVPADLRPLYGLTLDYWYGCVHWVSIPFCLL